MALPTLFAPSAGDQSLTYLYGIFGTVNGVIHAPNGATTGTMVTLLGTMFAKFNTIILAVAVLIVVYTTVVGIMNTAHEGQFMGKNWNNLWIPIRTVMGIALLVPTGSGYCGIQIIMMWVIVQGIGAADTLWGTALNFYAQFGSVYAKVAVPTLEVKSSIRGLFQGLVCAKSAAATYANPVPGDNDVKYFCTQNPSNTFCRNAKNSAMFAPSFSNPAVTSYSLGPANACGTLRYCNLAALCAGGANSLPCKTCQISQQTLQSSIPLLAEMAQKYVELDYQYMTYWAATREAAQIMESAKNNPAAPKQPVPKLNPPKFVREYCDADNNPACVNIPSPVGDDMGAPGDVIEKIYWNYGLKDVIGKTNDQDEFISVMVNAYAGAMDDAVREYITNLNAQSSKTLPAPLQNLNYSGWIIAGASYFLISQGNYSIVSALMPNTSYNFDTNVIPIGRKPLTGYRNNFNAASTLVCLSQGGSDCSSMMNSVMSGPANGAADAINIYQAGLSAYDTDAVSTLMNTGNTYLNLAETIFWLFFAITLILAIVAMIVGLTVIGTGLGGGGISIITHILALFGPLVSLMVTFLLTLGTMYAIFIPLVPFTIFTMGAIGWMISTVEAMVAGPLVALGIISPGGHHEVMGKAEPALGLLFGIFLRPSLMIFGLFAGMLLISQVMKLGNFGFMLVSNTTTLTGAGMFKHFIVMLTHASFDVALVTKTFSVIHIIPERVLSWISIQVPHEGAGELQEIKAGTEKGAAQADAIGKGVQSTGEGLGKMLNKGGGKKGGPKMGG